MRPRIKDHPGEMVRGTVEEALNAMPGAEADRLCGVGRYERSEGRQDTRAGSYDLAYGSWMDHRVGLIINVLRHLPENDHAKHIFL